MSDLSKNRLCFFLVIKEDFLDEVLEAFLELDVRGATVLDSVGMGRILAYEIPIFAGLRSIIPGNRPYNKTIFTIIEEEKMESLVHAIEQICGDFSTPGTGVMFTIPITFVKGLAQKSLS
jgi:nitrogen regulatory protein P-II 1